MILLKHRFLLILGLFLLSFRGCAWFNGNGDAHRFPIPRNLFSSVGKVIEISNGSMDTFTDLLKKNDINFVLFYAPWCGQSWNAAQEFRKAANILYREVSFIAINCWTGTCSQNQRVDVFPKLVAIHTRFDGVEYKGVHRASKMVVFLYSIIRPFVYVGTNAELAATRKSSQELVIGHFNKTMINNKKYSTFFNLALQFSPKVSRPLFAVVTNAKLALEAGVDNISDVSYHCLNQPVLLLNINQSQKYNSSNSFTTKDLTKWIDANRCELVIQLTPTTDRKEYFMHQLSKGPALILFLPSKFYRGRGNHHLLDTYIHAAALYFNCTCNRTRIYSVSQKSEATHKNNTAGTSVPMNLIDEAAAAAAADTSRLTRLNIISSQGHVFFTQKELNMSHLLAPPRTCQSFKVQQQSDSIENNYNVCNVCHTFQNAVFGLPNILKNNILATLSSFINGCSTMKPLYYPLVETKICCSGKTAETNKYLSSLEQMKTVHMKSFTQIERSLNNVLSELLDSFITPLKGTGLESSDDQVKGNNSMMEPRGDTEDTLPRSSSLREHQDLVDNSSADVVGNNSCGPKGHVTQFAGAGCYSNRSVNFFVMDSTEYWEVAERLGVNSTSQGKIALVVVDFENDAQYVLDEKLKITNSSIVEFVMAFMAGKLVRRLRSGRVRSHKCPSSQTCVKEVVTSNFDEIVLDETKDVLLLYYTPWCGYCQSLGPVLLTVARFFQNISDVTIARINADDNDLPWELYVAHYPSFIFFPAYRKDFSVRFPDLVERTAANIICFIFEHGVKARKTVEDFQLPETVKNQITELEISLHQVEEEKRLIEVKLKEALRAKELLNFRRAVAIKSLKQTEDDLMKERDLRLATEYLNKNLERQRLEVEEKVLKLVAGSKIILNDLGVAEAKLKEKEKQLIRLSLESRRILAENDELFEMLKKKETALQGEKEAVLELQKTLAALRRRATYLEISNNILRSKLKDSESKARYSNRR